MSTGTGGFKNPPYVVYVKIIKVSVGRASRDPQGYQARRYRV